MELHFRKIGQGPALVILHGLFGSSDNWQSLGKRWAENYTVYMVDQRNHGHSPWSNEFSYELMAADVLELFHSENITKAHLLGHSMGGKTAMRFAQLYPQYLDKLIVADIGPKALPPHHDSIIAALKSVDFSVHTTRKMVEEQLIQNINDFGTRQFLLKNLYWKSEGQLAWRINLDVLSEKIQDIIGGMPTDEVNLPCLFLRGELSGYIKAADYDSIQKQFTNCAIKTIAGAGHWLHAEKPDEFYQLVSAFMVE